MTGVAGPCRVCGRQLDDCGTCVCGKPRADDEVVLHLGGARPPVVEICERCGRQYEPIAGVTPPGRCLLCRRD